MRKTVLFLSVVAMFVFVACCGGKKDGCCSKDEKQCGKDSTAICHKGVKKAEFFAKWAKFDSLAVEEQEALLAKRAKCFAKMLEKSEARCQCTEECTCGDNCNCTEASKCTEKCKCYKECKCTDECKSGDKKDCCKKDVKRHASKMKICGGIKAEWGKYETFTIAEKKAFFDKVDMMFEKTKNDCKKAEKKCPHAK